MKQNYKILIALDLDGTSVVYSPKLEMEADLVAYLASVRDSGVAWVMNSDRFTGTMAEIAALLPAALKPAGLLSCQRFIHLLDGDEAYLPVESWNREQIQLHSLLWDAIKPFFPQWRTQVESRFRILESVVNDMVFAFMVAPGQTPELRLLMRQFISGWPDAQVSGNHDWTFILHAAFSKARVLKKGAELLGIAPDHVIAVGDGINDISMLDGSVTRMVGCPANASPEVQQTVRAAGGVVAVSEEAAGTLEVIKHYLGRLL
jgi:hydroxymethylpyrimidine pyrophosphatase-like HAD family hydrolase